jgi:transposase
VDTIEQETAKREQARTEEIDVARPQERRRYSVEYKRRVVEETLMGEDSVSVVARRHDLNANLLFNWRKRYLSGGYDEEGGSSLIPITVSPMPEAPLSAPDKKSARNQSSADRLEIVLSGGHRLVVEGSMSTVVLRTALEVLTG